MKDTREAINALMQGRPFRTVVAPLWDGIFATGVLGKEYASDVTTDEILDVADLCGFDPILRLEVQLSSGRGGACCGRAETDERNLYKRRYKVERPL